MNKTLLIIALITGSFLLGACKKITQAAPVVACEKGDPEHPNAAKYQAVIDQLLEIGVPGVSMTVISPEGTWSKTGGYADLKNNVTMSPCHTLRVGSVTKIFCAATILKLQDEGLLTIEDKITQYLPKNITDNLPNGNDCTIRQLLEHTSGIPDYLDIHTILAILNGTVEKRTALENLETVYDKKADFVAGTDKLYGNSNYLVLSLIIQQVTGKSSFEVVTEKIIQPLGLNDTYASTVIPASFSRGYFDIHDNGNIIDRTEIDHHAVGGQDMLDGGIIANSYNLAVFLRALMHGELFSDEALTQMQTYQNITQDLGDNLSHLKQYGLGLMRVETTNGWAAGHYGNVHCFGSFAYHFPEQDVTVALIRNGTSTDIKQFFESKEILDLLF